MLYEVNVNSYKLYSSSEVDFKIEKVKNLNSKNISWCFCITSKTWG